MCWKRTEPRTQATCTKKFGKDRASGSGDILAVRQTDPQTNPTHRHTYSSQCFATAPTGEVTTFLTILQFS